MVSHWDRWRGTIWYHQYTNNVIKFATAGLCNTICCQCTFGRQQVSQLGLQLLYVMTRGLFVWVSFTGSHRTYSVTRECGQPVQSLEIKWMSRMMYAWRSKTLHCYSLLVFGCLSACWLSDIPSAMFTYQPCCKYNYKYSDDGDHHSDYDYRGYGCLTRRSHPGLFCKCIESNV